MTRPDVAAGVVGTEIRSFWFVALAYFVGALAGAGTGAITFFAGELADSGDVLANFGEQFSPSLETASLLFFVCLVFELILATPVLIVGWILNWRPPGLVIAAAFGFFVSGLLAAAVSSIPLPDGTSGPLGYFTGRELTVTGWWRLVRNVAEFGAIGAVTAAAFSLVAIRRRN